jgi:hypothetical protein
MDTDAKTTYSNTLLNPTRALEMILPAVNCAQLRTGLQMWFDISLQKHNHFHASFTTEQLTLFNVKIPDLVLVRYTYQSEVQKGEGNER